MHQLDAYRIARNHVLAYFGYCDDWRVLPLDDCRQYVWQLKEREEQVLYATSLKELTTGEGLCFSAYLGAWPSTEKTVYRGPEYTAIVCDIACNGHASLVIFANTREVFATPDGLGRSSHGTEEMDRPTAAAGRDDFRAAEG